MDGFSNISWVGHPWQCSRDHVVLGIKPHSGKKVEPSPSIFKSAFWGALGAYLAVFQLASGLCSGTTPGGLGRPYVVPGMEPRSASCKANSLPSVLSLQPKSAFIWGPRRLWRRWNEYIENGTDCTAQGIHSELANLDPEMLTSNQVNIKRWWRFLVLDVVLLRKSPSMIYFCEDRIHMSSELGWHQRMMARLRSIFSQSGLMCQINVRRFNNSNSKRKWEILELNSV